MITFDEILTSSYLVGGAVRDMLLGRECSDQDFVVVGRSIDDMLNAGLKMVGHDFPVFIDTDTSNEFALARTERKSGIGHKGFTVNADPTVTLEEDLQRRDLTINAIALGDDGTLVDPWGGRDDIEKRILRHVSDSFADDPLRVLRVARFAAELSELGFTIAPETQQLMSGMVRSGELNTLTVERVWKEMKKAMATPRPSVFFSVLRDCGALKVILPELDALFGVPQPPKHHPEIDTGLHTMMVLDMSASLSPDFDVRFASLLHDLGKATTPEELLPAHHDHEKESARLVKNVCARFKVSAETTAVAVAVADFHAICHRAMELTAKRMLALFEDLDAFRKPDRLFKFTKACEADARGRTGFEDREYSQPFILMESFDAACQVTGKSLIKEGASPDKKLGQKIHARRVGAISARLVETKKTLLQKGSKR